jgi:site-specific DNA-methyltransferase (adenine-specific)
LLDQTAAPTGRSTTRSRSRPRRTIRVGDQAIHVDDCVTVLAAMPERSVDVVVTSPPYNIGLKYSSYDDGGSRPEYLAWLRDVALLLKRVMKDDASFFLNIAGTNSDPWIAADAANAMREVFRLQNAIIWVKSLSIGDDTFGHFKPVNSGRYLNHTHEHVFHFTKEGKTPLDRLAVGVPFKDKSNIARWGHDRDRRCAGDVWFIPYETIRSKAQRDHHPSPFPVGLPERCIRLTGVGPSGEAENSGPVVLDPFLGIGSTLLAAQRLGCRGIGIEIDPGYAESAAWRLRERLI